MNSMPDYMSGDADGSSTDVRRRRRRRIIIGAVIVLLAVVLAVLALGRGKDAATAANAQGATANGGKQAPAVTVIVPGRADVAGAVSATGSLAARRDMPVGVSGEGGTVVRVLVEAGDWVRAGQALAVIDRGVQAQQANQQSAQIRAAQADANLAQAQLDRALKLVDRGFISRADIDQKTATRDAARARVAVARAQLGETNARIGRLDVRSPAAGLVLTRAVEPGQVVSSGSGALFRIARGGELEMQARVAESDMARLKVGMPARVVPVGGTESFAGQIWQLSPVIDPNTRQGLARIAVAYHPALRPGGFAGATVTSGSNNVPLLPESAVQSDAKGNYVYIVDAANKVERRDVKVGEVQDNGIAVLSGLQGNERVVLSAGAFLNPGDAVRPERAAATVAAR